MSGKTLTVLERLAAAFEEAGVSTTIIKKEDDGHLTDELITYHRDFGLGNDEAVGEFYFIEDEQTEEGVCFECNILMSDGLNPLFEEEVCETVAKLNYYVPLGKFSVDISGTSLIYRLTQDMNSDMDDDDMFYMADQCCENALAVAERFMQLFMEINSGDSSPEDAVMVVTDMSED